jgi:hypothetical protein
MDESEFFQLDTDQLNIRGIHDVMKEYTTLFFYYICRICIRMRCITALYYQPKCEIDAVESSTHSFLRKQYRMIHFVSVDADRRLRRVRGSCLLCLRSVCYESRERPSSSCQTDTEIQKIAVDDR